MLIKYQIRWIRWWARFWLRFVSMKVLIGLTVASFFLAVYLNYKY